MTENRSGDAMDSRDGTRRPATLDDLLTAAARPAPVDAEAAERALSAFLAARDTGALSASPRRRDDWRTTGQRRRTVWIKTALGALAGTLMLGGVAMATGTVPAPFDPEEEKPRPHPGVSNGRQDGSAGQDSTGSQEPAGTPSVPPSAGLSAEARAADVARCRAYEAKAGHGQALEATAWQRLEEAAGGPDAVTEYCARLLHPQSPRKTPEELPGGGKDQQQPRVTDREPGGTGDARPGAGPSKAP
ncbi:hypothetical protein [Streptomyces sp. NPDC059909]|uniref:hypothetical protein n=1 Tax=Streptomyces sp. NPDC059909 TaxID=3346998 RepID=UPI0036492F4B